MLVQVIHCHPLIDSYNHALFQTIITVLEDKGHQVTATDLYREQFDPVMSIIERRTYYMRRDMTTRWCQLIQPCSNKWMGLSSVSRIWL
ncbi:MAG: NAD(P)H-dependent oxidoreductase [Alphaproteobacteria bacterium]|nr:NAD(P)H-dependent oxidoreductase [Alphaproteobacteria bacterium]